MVIQPVVLSVAVPTTTLASKSIAQGSPRKLASMQVQPVAPKVLTVEGESRKPFVEPIAIVKNWRSGRPIQTALRCGPECR